MAIDPVHPARIRTALVTCVLVWCGVVQGCSSSTRPGDLSRVQPVSDASRAGNVYLLRGWIGIFSAGIDDLGTQINTSGARATVFQEAQWAALADAIAESYGSTPVENREPLVLIGHSYGADGVVRIANRLAERAIGVDLLITLDPVTPPKVSANVRRVYNLYQSNGMLDAFPWLRGIPLEAAPGAAVEIRNMDIRTDRKDLLSKDLDHFNIEKQPLIHRDVLSQVALACPPREVYLAERQNKGLRRQAAGTAVATPTQTPSSPSGAGTTSGAGTMVVPAGAAPRTVPSARPAGGSPATVSPSKPSARPPGSLP